MLLEICIKDDWNSDIVCGNEEKNALIDLCDKIKNKQSTDDVTNCWVKTIGPEYLKNRNVIRKNSITKPVDINKNPMIDIEHFEENRLYRPMAKLKSKMIPIETIRRFYM